MSLADEIEKLQRLRDAGSLSEAEFQRAKAMLLSGRPYSPGSRMYPTIEAIHRLTRSSGDKWLGGVCGGLAQVSPFPSWAWRLIFSFLAVIYGIGLVPYILLWIFVPSDEALSPAGKPHAYSDDLA